MGMDKFSPKELRKRYSVQIPSGGFDLPNGRSIDFYTLPEEEMKLVLRELGWFDEPYIMIYVTAEVNIENGIDRFKDGYSSVKRKNFKLSQVTWNGGYPYIRRGGCKLYIDKCKTYKVENR